MQDFLPKVRVIEEAYALMAPQEGDDGGSGGGGRGRKKTKKGKKTAGAAAPAPAEQGAFLKKVIYPDAQQVCLCITGWLDCWLSCRVVFGHTQNSQSNPSPLTSHAHHPTIPPQEKEKDALDDKPVEGVCGLVQDVVDVIETAIAVTGSEEAAGAFVEAC